MWSVHVALSGVVQLSANHGLTGSPDQLTRLRRVLGEIGCEPHTVTATSLRLSATIDDAQAATVQQALHAEFV